jgi:acyl transferase domain-containing protein
MSEPLEGIAIVGLAARFPGAADAGQFWRNLEAGVESISFLTGEELAAAGVDPRDLSDPLYVPAKGVLDGADRFDAAFFGLTPREAEVMDPQHRVFLECAWEALEDAGCDPWRFGATGTGNGRVGVWAGSGLSSYLIANLLPPGNQERLESLGALQVLLLNDRDFLATRTSYALDLKGPSASVQTACSTSLVAVHLACQSLFAGECDLVLAGGVSISMPLCSGYLYQEGSVSSPDGHCRAFDAAAAGAVEGNGCGIVALKRLSDAVADGDRVYAVLRGSAVNNDGAAKAGFTAPSVEGQADVISEALLMAGVGPETIGYVEAHGSGTPLGDPIEMAALAEAFRSARDAGDAGDAGAPEGLPAGSCAVSSVKTAIGHCNTAAGVAGLIKATLALVHRTLPPSLHFATPNPQIDFAGGPFYVPTAAEPWERGETPRRAGVSSFGLGGTNVHVVLEEAPETEPGDVPSRPAQLLVVSARSAEALDQATARLARHLEESSEDRAEDQPGIADIAWTLATGRRGFEHRRIAVARDRRGAIDALRTAGATVSGWREAAGTPPVVFLFPGLGDQYVDMARGLYETEPAFRAEIDLCAGKLAPALGVDLREVMFSAVPKDTPASGPDLRALLRPKGDGDTDPAEARLRRTLYAQPACFVVEYALGRLLFSWGIVPQALLGYSLGEYVAACLAGSLTLDEALTLVALRARRIEALPGGAMLAVPLAEDEVRALLPAELSLAATNGPHFSVVAGTEEAVTELERLLAGRGVTCLRLRTTHAFHSAQMEPAVSGFTEYTREVYRRTGGMRPPGIPWLSNVTGRWITATELADPDYWARHMRSTVRFAEGLAELLAEPDRVFLEVGPGATLGTLVQQHPAAGAHRIAIPTLRRAEEGGSDLEHLLTAVGRLWIAGVEVDWARFHGGERRLKVALPTYPFERQRYWIDPPASAPKPAANIGGIASPVADLADWFWVPAWNRVPIAAPAPRSASQGEGPFERWLVFLDDTGLGERLAARLRGQGQAVFTVKMGSGFAALGEGDFTVDPGRREDYDSLLKHLGEKIPGKILHLWGLTPDEPSFAVAQTAGLLSLTLLAQAIAEAGGTSPLRLGLVANGLAEVLDGDAVHPGKATVLGALKVVRQELTRLAIGAIDLPPAGEAAVERRIDQLLAEMAGPAETAVALRGRQRFVRGFERVRLAAHPTAAPALDADGVYLVVLAGLDGLDGLDGLAGYAEHGPGLALAEHLAEWVGARVGIVVAPDCAADRLTTLEQKRDRVLVSRSAPAAALAATRARFGPVRGAFWTVGAFTGGLLRLKTAAALRAALDPVAEGAEALLAACRAEPEPPEVVLFSTTAAVTGGLGEIELAAASSYLEALAARGAGGAEGGDVRAVLWDPYQWDGWLVATAASAAGAAGGVSAADVEAGLLAHAVPAERSAAALERLLAHPLPGVSGTIVSSLDLHGIIAETDGITADVLFPQAAPGQPKASRPALRTPYEPPRDELEEQLAALWQELFGIAPIGRDDSFLELGGHSLLAIQIVTQVKALLGAELPVTALFEAPTVAELAAAVRRARGEVDPAQLEALLALVEGLSPEEAAERLSEIAAERLAEIGV